MKKLLVLAVASMVASPAFAADLKWYGEVGARYSNKSFDDGMALNRADSFNGVANTHDASKEVTKKHDIAARLGATGGKDHVDYGVGVRTQGAINNNYTTYNVDSGDESIGLDLAYFRYSNDFGFGDVSVTVGRGENVFAYDRNSQFLFDNDVTFNGFGWKWKMGNFGLNASQYILGGISEGTRGASQVIHTASSDADSARNGGWSNLMGWQPNFSMRFSDEIEAMFAVGYYLWTGTNGSTNNIHGEQSAVSAGATNNPDATSTFIVDNPQILQFLVDTSLPMGFNLSFEYLRNKKYYYDEFAPATANQGTYGSGKSREVDNKAWAATLGYGKIAAAHDWKVSYSYGKRGLASGLNTYTNNLFLADQKGHTLAAEYALADGLTLGGKFMSLKEISSKDANGNGVGNATTSAGQGSRMHKTTYWQLTAGVAF